MIFPFKKNIRIFHYKITSIGKASGGIMPDVRKNGKMCWQQRMNNFQMLFALFDKIV